MRLLGRGGFGRGLCDDSITDWDGLDNGWLGSLYIRLWGKCIASVAFCKS